jgi:prophage tail gpP-like protein
MNTHIKKRRVCKICQLVELRLEYDSLWSQNKRTAARFVGRIILSETEKLLLLKNPRNDGVEFCVKSPSSLDLSQALRHHKMFLEFRKYIRGTNTEDLLMRKHALNGAEAREQELFELYDEAVLLNKPSDFVCARRADWQRQKKKIQQRRRRVKELEASRKSPKTLDLQTIFRWLDGDSLG